ncbi:methylated-DNA--[protein]-cysteine S-methyltransferase [Neptunomonas japonica]|uniref:methylated-DNA--[protein]-cysteine S-methyltransferase n=1 Tax=Neptunomonas japonica TaxID=417574 RepID=UPI0003FF3AAA|nr:methylated-DNA--[protein]-cysteine S-methyltransferase [Neptunomonas japonica]
MIDQDSMNYTRIAEAIAYIKDNFKEQPSLNEVAAAISLSPFHFQRLFSDWAGVSPKKFMQYISIEHAKGLLKDQHLSLLDTAYETGLSGTSRLHDLFINIEGMTPGEFKKGGDALQINYSFSQTPFGQVIVASTGKGVCHIAFEENAEQALTTLKQRFPYALYQQSTDKLQQDALLIFQKDWQQLDKIKLHLHGTAFQLKVWDSLLKIPKGRLASYGEIATAIGNPKASRAVGTAIGSNPVAFLIPCHRVIQASGSVGGYMWGSTRKSAIIGWEASQKATL